jgi:hypothetical protein
MASSIFAVTQKRTSHSPGGAVSENREKEIKDDNVRDTASEQEARTLACPTPIGAPTLVCIASNISIRSGWREMDAAVFTGGSAPKPAVLNSGFGMYFYVPVSPRMHCAVRCSVYLILPGLVSWSGLPFGCATLQPIRTWQENQARK